MQQNLRNQVNTCYHVGNMVGGRLVYSTCSFLCEENEDVVDWFLDKHKDFTLLPVYQIFERLRSSRFKDMRIPSDCQNFLKLTPFKHNTDGFFGSVFIKKR